MGKRALTIRRILFATSSKGFSGEKSIAEERKESG
jgi:hypothetical protein